MGTSSSIGKNIKPDKVNFSSNIPFNKPLLYSDFYKLTENVNFSPIVNNAIVGSCCVYKVIGNGLNTVSFSSSIKKVKGSNFNNGNDILNILIFFYDGIYFWVNIFQEENAQPIDLISPTLSSAVISDGVRNKIILTFNETLNAGSVPNLTTFTNNLSKTLSSINISGNNVELTYTTNFGYEDVVFISYSSSGNPLQDNYGNIVTDFLNQTVINNINPPDIIAPVLQSAVVNNNTPSKVILTYNESINPSYIPSTTDYSIVGKTISSVSVVGSSIEITVNVPFVYGNVVTISYTGGINKVQDMDGNIASNFVNQSVTNNISPSSVVFTWTALTNATTDGTYLINAGGNPSGGRAIQTIDATSPFEILHTVPNTRSETNATVIYLDNVSTDDFAWVTGKVFKAGFYQYEGSVYAADGGYSANPTGITNLQPTDKLKMVKSGNNILLQYNPLGTGSWTTIYTYTGALTGINTLYVKIIFAAPSVGNKISVLKL